MTSNKISSQYLRLLEFFEPRPTASPRPNSAAAPKTTPPTTAKPVIQPKIKKNKNQLTNRPNCRIKLNRILDQPLKHIH